MVSQVRRYAFFLLAAAVVASCELSPFSVLGLKCPDDRACGDGLVCLNGRCALPQPKPDAGPLIPRDVNLLANPGFEDVFAGGIAEWEAGVCACTLSPTMRLPHRGTWAGRLQSTGAAQSLIVRPANTQPGAELGMLFCGSIWVRADNDAGEDVTLTIREIFADGGLTTSLGTRAIVRSAWVQLSEEYASIGNSSIQFRLVTKPQFEPGSGIFVDDAWLSLSSGSRCP